MKKVQQQKKIQIIKQFKKSKGGIKLTVFFSLKKIKNDKITEKELCSFTKGMYYLLKGKIELTEALRIISEGYRKEIKNRIIKTVGKIEGGNSLGKAFGSLTQSKEFLELVKIGEETGNLEIVFKNLFEKYKFREKLKRDVRNLSIYPVTVIITAFVIVTVLLRVVVPKFTVIYSDLDQELPELTKAIIRISEITDKYGFVILIFLALGVFIILFLKKNNQKYFEKIAMKIFIFGEIYKNIAILNFTQNMYSLTDAGISFPESLKMCANSGNVLLNEEVRKIIFRLEKGAGIGKSFEKLSFFNEEYKGFLKIGEKTGKMTVSFENLTDIYSEKIQGKTQLLLKVMEPMSIIFIGIIIGIIIFAVMLPMFKIGEMI